MNPKSSNQSQLHISTLGPLTIQLNGKAISFRSRKAQALLCYLAVEQKPVTRQALAGLLWPDTAEATAHSNLRTQIVTLRRALGEILELSQSSVSFAPTVSLWLDMDHLRTVALEGGTAENQKQVVARYQADFLDGFRVLHAPEFEQWVLRTRERLRRYLLVILRRLADPVSADHLADALFYARRWTADDPLDEAAHRQAMRLLAQMGQRADALAQYDVCRQLLADELTVAPDAETEELRTQIASGEPILLAPLGAAPKHNLPASATSFVGRQPELTELIALLQRPDCRLVSLLGMGGMGKSRLALQVARTLLKQTDSPFDDGIFWVSLVNIETEEAFVEAILLALDLGGGDGKGRIQKLVKQVGDQQLLLVLDNFEQLIAHAQILTRLLEAAPNIKLFVTSREPLDLRAEWRYALAGLDQEESALHLFCQRAEQTQPTFLFDEHALDVQRICHLVGGLPLAIELAATQLQGYSCAEIATNLAVDLDILQTATQDVPARHLTMRRVLDATWQRLAADESDMWAQLTLFRGGFSAQAAQAVAGLTHAHLTEFVAKCLVQSDSEQRYTLHPLIQQYLTDQMTPLCHDQELSGKAGIARYVAYYLDVALTEAPAMSEQAANAWIERVAADHDNICHALDQALTLGGNVEHYLQAVVALGSYWYSRGPYWVGIRYLQLFMQACAGSQQSVNPHTIALAHGWRGNLHFFSAQYAEALTHFDCALSMLKQLNARVQIPWVHYHMAHMFGALGNFGAAQQAIEQSLAGYQRIAHPHGEKFALEMLGTLAEEQGDFPRAQSFYKQALKVCRQHKLGEEFAASIMNSLGMVHTRMGNYDVAAHYFALCWKVFQKRTGQESLAWLLRNQGCLALKQHKLRAAKHYFDRSLRIRYAKKSPSGLVSHLFDYAHLYLLEEEPTRAATLIGAGDRLLAEMQVIVSPCDQGDLAQLVATVRQQLGDEIYTLYYENGQQITLEEAVALARGEA